MIIPIDAVELEVLRGDHFDSNNWRRALGYNKLMTSKQFDFDIAGVCMPHLVVVLKRQFTDADVDDPVVVVPAGSSNAVVIHDDNVRQYFHGAVDTTSFYGSEQHAVPTFDPSTNVGFVMMRSDRIMGVEKRVYSTTLASLMMTKPGDMIIPICKNFKTFGTHVYTTESSAMRVRSGRMLTMLAVSDSGVTFVESDTSRIVHLTKGMSLSARA